MAALELRHALGHPVRAEPGHDHHLVEADVLEVRERDVEDRPVAVDRQQRLRKRVGQRLEALARARREHQADHSSPASSSSYSTTPEERWTRAHENALSVTKSTPRTLAIA